jgi:hypothetical protein
MFCRMPLAYGPTGMQHSTAKRFRAARALGGYKNLEALGDAVNMPNLSARNMREVEAGNRALHPHEAEAVAKACGIDPAFFIADLADLRRHGNEEEISPVAALLQVQEVLHRLTAGQGGTQPELPAGRDETGEAT